MRLAGISWAMSELLLLSGGIDSIAIAAWRRPALCLTIDYGHKPARAEALAASEVCKDLGLKHELLSVPMASLGSGDLSGGDASPLSKHSEFWPFRNQLLITLGGMVAAKNMCSAVVVGTVATDQRHLDGSKKFVASMHQVLKMQEGELQLIAPAIDMTSSELVQHSKISGTTLAWAHSCHVGDLACGQCRGCQKHSEVMQALGIRR